MNRALKEWYDKYSERVFKLMRDLWEHPETAFREFYACQAVKEFLTEQGFTNIETHSARDFKNPDAKPNTIIATYGSGKPVIGILGEYDALPGLGQEAVPYESSMEGPGHGCGHCMMGGGSAAAAAAIKYAMEKEGIPGTLKLIENPAEEGGCGKGWLAENGVYDDLDMALMWHASNNPYNYNPTKSLPVYDVLFKFHGIPVHPSQGWKGRSALDAVQLMNMGCEFLREHMTKDCMLHYVITNGGKAPNIVPDFAEVHYMFRSYESDESVRELFERGVKVAKGAAMMTETEMEYEITSINPSFCWNLPLSEFMYQSALKVPPLTYEAADYEYAAKLYQSVKGTEAPTEKEQLIPTTIYPYNDGKIDETAASSSDMGIVSRICPICYTHGSGMVCGLPGHHWAAVSTSGTRIGQKAGLYGFELLAQGAIDAFRNPEIVDKAWEYHKSLHIPPMERIFIKE